MIFASITRLRIRSIRFMPQFIVHTIRTVKQVKSAGGYLGGSLLADRELAFWTMTLWREENDMRRYMTSGAHIEAMPRLLDWCDEASMAHWLQDDASVPEWLEADRRMRAEGRPSRVRYPSSNHWELTYRTPRMAGGLPMKSATKA
jgi:hypothetical protein